LLVISIVIVGEMNGFGWWYPSLWSVKWMVLVGDIVLYGWCYSSL
jgi:hypothetical protein